MSALRLELKSYEARFRMRFRHASASRAKACSVVAIAHSVDGIHGGITGYGEGCPRAYVTGESIDSAARFFAAHRPALESSVANIEELRAWISAHRAAIDANPAAFAAIEIALLDLFARRMGTTLEPLLGLPPAQPVAVSAVFGVTGAATAALIAAGYRAFGMVDAKVKLSSDRAADRRRVAAIRRVLGPATRLRVDANNLFRDADACAAHLDALGAEIWAIEEPLPARDIEGQRRLAQITGARIILDESAVRRDALDGLDGDGWIVNLRVSKHGGLLRSLEMLETARSRGLGLIIGSHVGETGLLARAGLALAAACGDRLLASEGGYGGYLLAPDLARPSLRFNRHGVLDVMRTPVASGLGCSIDQTLLTDIPT